MGFWGRCWNSFYLGMLFFRCSSLCFDSYLVECVSVRPCVLLIFVLTLLLATGASTCCARWFKHDESDMTWNFEISFIVTILGRVIFDFQDWQVFFLEAFWSWRKDVGLTFGGFEWRGCVYRRLAKDKIADQHDGEEKRATAWQLVRQIKYCAGKKETSEQHCLWEVNISTIISTPFLYQP